jgi:hypothetical protein
MPAEDMYSDGPSGASEPSAPADGAEPKDSDEGDTGKTGLLSKSVLGDDLKPGHICEVEIVADHGDDYEVKYAKEGEHDEDKEAAGKPAAPESSGASGEDTMGSMLQD